MSRANKILEGMFGTVLAKNPYAKSNNLSTKEIKSIVAIDTESSVNTDDPLSNSFLKSWNHLDVANNSGYLLLELRDMTIILSSYRDKPDVILGYKGYISKDNKVKIAIDSDSTPITRFRIAKIIASANNILDISKSFPVGSYRLFVSKAVTE